MAPSASPGIIGSLMNKLSSKGSTGGKDSGSGPMDRIARLGMSPRQQELNRLWGWYRCMNYSARALDWNGKKNMEPLELEAVASRGSIPPGFIDVGGQGTPLKFRRPSSPYALVKVCVDRFTGLLFSENQSPEINVDGDEMSANYLRAVVDVSRLWQAMIRVRTFGGATGSACIGFQFVDGKPVVEVHDPRWVQPAFSDRSSLLLEKVEKRYLHPVEVRDPATGRFETKQYWYRRIIDMEMDTVFKPAEVGDGEEPKWEIDKQVAHGFGFCPVVWVQNMPVEDDIDGDPDCHGIYEVVEQIDALISQANRGIIANCDPTLIITSKGEMGSDIKKGSDNAIKLPEGSSAQYLEMQASGPKAAMEQAESLRKFALEVAQCVLEHPGDAGGGRTATEVTRTYMSMLQKTDVMREQYGERCIKPLLEMMFKAASALAQPVEQVDPATGQPAVDPVTGQPIGIVKSVLKLPPQISVDPMTGMQVKTELQPGSGGSIRLQWPDYFPPSLDDTSAAVKAAGDAKTAGLIDEETAIKFAAPFFSVDNVTAMIQKIQAAAASAAEQQQQQMFGGMTGGFDEQQQLDEQYEFPEQPE